MADYTSSQMDPGNFSEAQNKAYNVLSSICGPNLALAFTRYLGKNVSGDQVVDAARTAKLWDANTGMHGPAAEKQLLDQLGVPAQYSPEVNQGALQQAVMQGSMGGISTPGHYFALQGYDPNTGLWDTGQTGSVYRGGNQYLTWDQMTKLGGAPQGQFIVNKSQPQQSSQAPGSGYDPSHITPTTTQGGMPAEFANKPYAKEAYDAAVRHGIDPNVFLRQINQESGFNPNAGSGAGAQGIAQIVPKYHPGVNTWDPISSLDYAANLDSTLLGQYGGDYTKALVAYNGGGGAVDAWNAGKGYTESKTYINNILTGYTPQSPTAGQPGGQSQQSSNTVAQPTQTQATPQRPSGIPSWVPQDMWGMYGNNNPLHATAQNLQGGMFGSPAGGLSGLVQSFGSMSNNPFSSNMTNPMSPPQAQPNIMSRMSRPLSLYG